MAWFGLAEKPIQLTGIGIRLGKVSVGDAAIEKLSLYQVMHGTGVKVKSYSHGKKIYMKAILFFQKQYLP